MMRSHIYLPVFLLATASSLPALAQTVVPDDVLTVRQRRVDDGSASGIRAGGFIISPGGEVQTVYDDNIFRTRDNAESDLITDVKPAIGIQSDWDRHAVFFGAEGDFGFYADHGAKNYADYGVMASGQYDLAYKTYLSAALSRAKRHEDFATVADTNGSRPVDYTSTREDIGFGREAGVIKLKASARNENVDLSSDVDPSVTGFAGDQTRNSQTVQATLSYEPVPGNDIFTTVTYDTTGYTLVNGADRRSNGGDVRAGVDFAEIRNLAGSVYGGYMLRSYDSGADDTSKPYFGARVTWDATRQTSVSLTYDKTFNETAVQNAAGVIHTMRRVAVRQDFTPRFTGTVTGGYDDIEYVGSSNDHSSNLAYGSVQGDYVLKKGYSLRASYAHQERTSDVASDEYKDNRVLFSLVMMR